MRGRYGAGPSALRRRTGAARSSCRAGGISKGLPGRRCPCSPAGAGAALLPRAEPVATRLPLREEMFCRISAGAGAGITLPGKKVHRPPKPVIPGRRAAPRPESMATTREGSRGSIRRLPGRSLENRGYGFRARRGAPPRNDEEGAAKRGRRSTRPPPTPRHRLMAAFFAGLGRFGVKGGAKRRRLRRSKILDADGRPAKCPPRGNGGL